MSGISLDVVGQNIVVYASTGITPLFRVLTRSFRVVLLQFFCFSQHLSGKVLVLYLSCKVG